SDARGLRSAPPPAPDGEGLSVSREPQTLVSFGSSSVKDSNAEEERAFSPVVRRLRRRRRCRYRRRPSKRKNSVLADIVHEGRESSSVLRSYNAILYRPSSIIALLGSSLALGSLSTSSGRRVAARDSRAGEEDWTKRKKQNKTSKAEAEEQKSARKSRAERVEAKGLRRRKVKTLESHFEEESSTDATKPLGRGENRSGSSRRKQKRSDGNPGEERSRPA
ncbi:hypothetical protein HN011_001802, partial [Eciton burchellii]